MSLVSIAIEYLKRYGFGEVLEKTFCHTRESILNKRDYKRVSSAQLTYGLNKEIRSEQIIISLTSYPPRFKNIGLCLKSLLLQSVKPDRIIVYFGSDTTESDITEEMRDFEQYGIEYRIDKEKNLKSHKKYYYALQEFSDAVVVTADDDLIYPKYWLEKMLDVHEKYPNDVCAWRVHKMEFDSNGMLKPYADWRWQYRKSSVPRSDLVATGGAGAVYPPNSLLLDSFSVDLINKLCPNADDLWLRCMELLNNKKVVWVKNKQVMPYEIPDEQSIGLNVANVGGGENDKQLRALMDFYDIKDVCFREVSE